MNIFDMLITRPFGWVFWAILNVINNYGVALILFSIVAKAILFPLAMKGKKGMVAQQRIQPKVKELEKKYKNDKTTYSAELQKLYQEEKVSPMAGCLPNLIVIPVMFALYGVITKPLSFIMGLSDGMITDLAKKLASLVTDPAVATHIKGMADGSVAMSQIFLTKEMAPHLASLTDIPNLMNVNFHFLGLDLSMNPTFALTPLILLPILSGLTAFASSFFVQKMSARLTPAAAAQMNGTNKMMVYTMPLVSVWIGFTLPAGITLYWIANNLLAILQEWIGTQRMAKVLAAEDAARALEEQKKQEKREEARLAQIENAKHAAQGSAASKKKKPTYKLKKAKSLGAGDGEEKSGGGSTEEE